MAFSVDDLEVRPVIQDMVLECADRTDAEVARHEMRAFHTRERMLSVVGSSYVLAREIGFSQRGVENVVIAAAYQDLVQGKGYGLDQEASADLALRAMEYRRGWRSNSFMVSDMNAVDTMIHGSAHHFYRGRLLFEGRGKGALVLNDANAAVLSAPAHEFWDNMLGYFIEYNPAGIDDIREKFRFLKCARSVLINHAYTTETARRLFGSNAHNLALTENAIVTEQIPMPSSLLPPEDAEGNDVNHNRPHGHDSDLGPKV